MSKGDNDVVFWCKIGLESVSLHTRLSSYECWAVWLLQFFVMEMQNTQQKGWTIRQHVYSTIPPLLYRSLCNGIISTVGLRQFPLCFNYSIFRTERHLCFFLSEQQALWLRPLFKKWFIFKTAFKKLPEITNVLKARYDQRSVSKNAKGTFPPSPEWEWTEVLISILCWTVNMAWVFLLQKMKQIKTLCKKWPKMAVTVVRSVFQNGSTPLCPLKSDLHSDQIHGPVGSGSSHQVTWKFSMAVCQEQYINLRWYGCWLTLILQQQPPFRLARRESQSWMPSLGVTKAIWTLVLWQVMMDTAQGTCPGL